MSLISKQFPKFRILYVQPEEGITQENFNEYHIEVDGPGGYTIIRQHELTFDLATQITSDDESKVRDALNTILIYRKALANDIESILKNELVSEYWK